MQEKKKLAIEVDNVQKIYKLYDKPSDRMKEAFGFGKKTKHKLHYALKGVDMKIYQGETVGIIGTNGSGKSTILKIITGEDLFQRYVRPAGLCGGHQYRAGDPDRG